MSLVIVLPHELQGVPYAGQQPILVCDEVARDLGFYFVVVLRADTERHGDWSHLDQSSGEDTERAGMSCNGVQLSRQKPT